MYKQYFHKRIQLVPRILSLSVAMLLLLLTDVKASCDGYCSFIYEAPHSCGTDNDCPTEAPYCVGEEFGCKCCCKKENSCAASKYKKKKY